MKRSIGFEMYSKTAGGHLRNKWRDIVNKNGLKEPLKIHILPIKLKQLVYFSFFLGLSWFECPHPRFLQFVARGGNLA